MPPSPKRPPPKRPPPKRPEARQKAPPALPGPSPGALDLRLAEADLERRRRTQIDRKIRTTLLDEPTPRGEDPYVLLARAISALLRS